MSSSTIVLAEEAKPQVEEEKVVYPNGGFQAWVQVAASFMVHFVVIGLLNIFGVYQAQYKQEPMLAGVSITAITIIGSVTAGGLNLFGPMSGWLADRFGYKTMSVVGAFLYALALILGSFSTEYWHLLITHGLIFGLAASIVYFPALTVLSHWFSTRKGLATGVAVCGAGVGGFALGPITQLMIANLGWAWSLRITGIAGGAILLVCSIILQPRFKAGAGSSLSYWEMLKDSRVIRFVIAGIFISFGYFVPFFFMATYAKFNGMSPSEGALLVGILNGASAVGRVVLGVLADKFGHATMLTTCLYLSSLSVFVIWPFSTSFGVLLVFALAYGFSAGGFISLFPTTSVAMFGTKNVASMIGLLYSGAAIGNLAGAPIAGILIDSFTTRYPNGTVSVNFIPAIMICGVMLFLGSTIILTIQLSEARRKRTA
ncbi:major facilitator superfamily domain-containing protein [Gorgonomyces haynaldii]|nr:major facilitator superfamily domain-containing protein [Gorgonomyces haynaldii]